MYYVIVSTNESGYWSNDHGWVYDVASATRFTLAERHLALSIRALTPDARLVGASDDLPSFDQDDQA